MDPCTTTFLSAIVDLKHLVAKVLHSLKPANLIEYHDRYPWLNGL